jgi:hypothetical protein
MRYEEAPVMRYEEAPVMRFEEAPVMRSEATSVMARQEEEPPIGRGNPPADESPLPPAPMPSVFMTQTMAELYVQQGLPGRAVAIYRELTMRAPDDARLAARLAEVIALAEGQDVIAPPAIVEEVGDGDGDGADDAADEVMVDVLGDLPLLDDFDPIPLVEAFPEADEDAIGHRFAADDSEPESVSDEPAIPSAFDFSEDVHRVAPIVSATDESMLAGLSFEAISLPTPASDGAGLDLPVGAGPSAREALRQLAHRPVATRAPRRPSVVPPAPRPTARRTGTAPSARAGSPPPADPTGDDFDQWLRGVS